MPLAGGGQAPDFARIILPVADVQIGMWVVGRGKVTSMSTVAGKRVISFGDGKSPLKVPLTALIVMRAQVN